MAGYKDWHTMPDSEKLTELYENLDTDEKDEKAVDKVSFICQRILRGADKNWDKLEKKLTGARWINGLLVGEVLSLVWDTEYDYEANLFTPAQYKFRVSQVFHGHLESYSDQTDNFDDRDEKQSQQSNPEKSSTYDLQNENNRDKQDSKEKHLFSSPVYHPGQFFNYASALATIITADLLVGNGQISRQVNNHTRKKKRKTRRTDELPRSVVNKKSSSRRNKKFRKFHPCSLQAKRNHRSHSASLTFSHSSTSSPKKDCFFSSESE